MFYPILRRLFFFILVVGISLSASQNVNAQTGNIKNSKNKDNKIVQKDSFIAVPPDTLIKKPVDTEGDGIIDSLDKCPDEKGVIQFDGCPMPDTDNDGLADDLDECPSVAGLIKYKGCPAGDRDGDKINDDEDKCPDTPGLARFDGCLTKDTDGDGVNDDDDKCIDVPGPASNFGCPPTRKYRKILKKQDGKKKSATSSGKN